MKHMLKRSVLAVSVAAAVLGVSTANATNGYFVHGYGTKSSGMAGVGIALPQDALAPATNPAGISFTGSRADAGIMLFNPRRDATLDASGLDGDGPGGYSGMSANDTSGAKLFLVPNAGFAMDLAGGMTMGFTMYANGGMNTRYNSNIYTNAFGPAIGNSSNGTYGAPGGFAAALEGGFSVPAATLDGALGMLYFNPNNDEALGVNLAQLILAPTVSYKIADNHAIGVSPLIGIQSFRAYGLGLFQGLSSDPGNVTNRGNDWAYGAGIRIGYTGKLTDTVTIGATAASKIYMTKFDKYKGLFAEDGDFDIPANFGIGIAFQPNDQLSIGFDVQRILYGSVASIANKGPTADQFIGGLVQVLSGGTVTCAHPAIDQDCKMLGNNDGYGFGWEDQTVYKLGVAYAVDDQWTVRAGYNYGKSPIPDKENLFNIIAPGIVEQHATLGLTYSPDKSSEISFAYMHAFRNDQSYDYTNPGTSATFGPQSYDTKIGMSQHALEVSYGLKF